ncbi:MAG: hypothetical protein WCO56_14300 [Verrucomicrobiota bacterium]
MNETTPNSHSKPARATLLCPTDQSVLPTLSRQCPLPLLPALGDTLLGHAIAFLAAQGVREICIVASDRTDQIRAAVGRGERWGVKLEVTSSPRDPVAQDASTAPLVLLLDRLPQVPEQPLWTSYSAWFDALLTLMPLVARERVGMREIMPNVFVGLRSQIAGDAKLIGPCWIGANANIGARTVIGPNAIIEDGVVLDESAEVVHSIIGPQTYVGIMTEVRHSFAWGRNLTNLRNGSQIEIVDRFLLDDLANSASRQSSGQPGWMAKVLRRLRRAISAPFNGFTSLAMPVCIAAGMALK